MSAVGVVSLLQFLYISLKSSDVSQKKTKISFLSAMLIASLPTDHLNLLERLCKFLTRIAANQQINKMVILSSPPPPQNLLLPIWFVLNHV